MLRHDSRKINSGDTFLCLPGGDAYIDDAKKRGAVDIIHCSRNEMGKIANDYFGDPSSKCSVIGITGTNGKTTVATIVVNALNRLGFNAKGQGTITGSLTTPESLDSIHSMADHVENGGSHFVMEVSSHAIHQNRISGITFKIKCLTNISQDHLDYHKTFENYRQTKLSFMANAEYLIFPDDFKSLSAVSNPRLKGAFNTENLQAALAILLACGISESDAKNALREVSPPPGRFELIDEGQPMTVIVDYAHTPDGLEKILDEAKKMANERQGKLISVFGCGGERDRGKRPQMTRISVDRAHTSILTLDNPRHEDTAQIFDDMTKGVPDGMSVDVHIISDRREAITKAINMAGEHDVVVIAGKGHETTQVIGNDVNSFDDREVARHVLKRVV